jgi:hypothetical protein
VIVTPASLIFATEFPPLVFPAAATVGIVKVPNPAMEITPFASVTFVTVKHNCFVPKLNIIFKFFANSLVPV